MRIEKLMIVAGLLVILLMVVRIHTAECYSFDGGIRVGQLKSILSEYENDVLVHVSIRGVPSQDGEPTVVYVPLTAWEMDSTGVLYLDGSLSYPEGEN